MTVSPTGGNVGCHPLFREIREEGVARHVGGVSQIGKDAVSLSARHGTKWSVEFCHSADDFAGHCLGLDLARFAVPRHIHQSDDRV